MYDLLFVLTSEKMLKKSNNIKKLRTNKGLSQKKLASLVGVSLRHIQNLESGNRGLSTIKMLSSLSQALGCSPNDIMGTETITGDSLANVMELCITIPYYTQKASAGDGILGDNNTKYPLVLDKNWLQQQFLLKSFEGLFCLTAHGESMEPEIKSGDTLICQECSTFNEGVYVISYLEEIFVKKLQKIDKYKIKIISSNAKYEDRIINLENLEEYDFRIIGRVIANLRKYVPSPVV